MKDRYKFLIVVAVFVAAYFIPFGDERVKKAILEAFYMIQDYAQKHVLLCLVPAFFIAGAITVFVSEASVMKYLGPLANKFLAYSVASVSGTILAVCSCTVLPLFAGIYRMGVGIGPATTFLYSDPTINILAIVLSTKVYVNRRPKAPVIYHLMVNTAYQKPSVTSGFAQFAKTSTPIIVAM